MTIAAVREAWKYRQAQFLAILHGLDAWASIHHTGILWTLGILYKFVLDALYIWAASPQYAYAGLVYQPDSIKYIAAAVMYGLLFAALPKAEHSISTLLLHLQFALTVAPLLSFYALSDGSSRYILMVFCSVLLQTWVVRRPVSGVKPVHIRGIRNYVTVALGVLTIFSLLIPIIYNGFAGLDSFNFSYIYIMRENATYPPGFSYVIGWMTNTILPFACVMFLHHKRYCLLAVCVFLQVLFYMETGYKFTLFILIPVIGIYFFSKTNHLLKCLYAGLIGLFFVILFTFRLDSPSGSGLGVILNALLAIRAVFHPADNKFNFYEYFSDHPKIFFSDGLVGKMFSLTYPYAGSSGQVIFAAQGGEFLEANMNTGYLGESYAQMGFAGMLLMAALLGVIVRGLEVYNSRERFCILAGLFSTYFIILNDGALFTTLFTGGMLLAFALVFIYFGKQQEAFGHGIQRL